MVVKTAFKVEFHNLFYLQKCFIEENEKSYNIQILLNFIGKKTARKAAVATKTLADIYINFLFT